MNINKIVKLKDNKYKIKLDGEDIVTYDNVILENDLLYKKSIDNTMYKEIIKSTIFYDAYNKVVKYILKKLRSEKEVKEYLNKFEIDSISKKKIISKLKEINLIDDKKYAKAYINDQIYLSKNGINKIRKNLLDQNIDSNVIEEELGSIDESIMYDRLERMIVSKIRNNKKYSNNELRMKITGEMVMLGYDKSLVSEIIENNIIESNSVIGSEYNKIYNKLSRKYSGDELLRHLKQKLYSRGFNSEEINEVMQKKSED